MSNVTTKHTPGPWLDRKRFTNDSKHYTPYVSAGDSARVLCYMNLSGAYNGFEGEKQAAADARLIAAAPELLNELSHLVRLMQPLEESGQLAVPGLATLNAARAAIAKATGSAA